MTTSAKPVVRAFFDEPTNTASYLVSDPATKHAAVIDPVLDYDQRTGRASTKSADAILKAAEEDGLTIDWILETHAHADHLTAAPYMKLKTGAKVGIGEHIREVQKIFRPVF
ncbi:MAG: MBL fold metallo-hydrolase, partial [Bauldia sp.]|nr:MBL fold metallo-hydrolase [Bauldia sp.]